METLVLTLDTVALMVILYFSYKGEKADGKPELGPFRIRDLTPAAPKPTGKAVATRPVRRR